MLTDAGTLAVNKRWHLSWTGKQLPALEQVRVAIRAPQTSTMVLLAKIFNNVNLKTSTILAKRLILDAWLGPGRTSTDSYIAVLKIQTNIRKDGRQV